VTKICVVGPSKKYFSGLTTHTIFLANAFSKNSKVSALLFRNLLPRFLYPGTKNVNRNDYSIELSKEISVYNGMDWNSPWSWIKAYNFLKKEKPDVIIMCWWTSAVAHMQLFLALANSLSIKSRLILEMHEVVDTIEAGKLLLRLYSRVMGRLIMNRADAFAVHSTTVRDQIIRIYHLKEDKVFVVPIGIYDSYYQNLNQESAKKELGINEEFVILNFGMIRKYKGVPCLVEAFNKLPGEIAANSRLVIAGEDWGDEEGLENLINSSPYNKQITFRPEFVPDSIFPRYFSAADVVVLPYLRTAGSAVASLAMAFGKPLIISDLESIKETLQEYKGTIFIPCGASSSITEKLVDLYYRHKEGKAQSYATPRGYNWDQVADLFQKIAGQINARNAGRKKQNA
jgi:glycosyltransferase involved in cell wall biosynthesis